MRKARSLERAARKVEQDRRERRTSTWMLVGVVVLMLGALVADMVFIGWQRHQRHLQHQQREGRTSQTRSGVQPDGNLRTGGKP